MALAGTASQEGFSHCPLLNSSLCDVTETSRTFTVSVYNPSAAEQTVHVRVPVVGDLHDVVELTEEGEPGGSPVAQIIALTQQVKDIPLYDGDDANHPGHPATHELVFRAESLPPLATK